MGRSDPLMGNRPLDAIIHPSSSNPGQWVHQLPLSLVITSQINVASHQRQESDHIGSCCFAGAKTWEMDDYERSQEWSICSSSPYRVDSTIIQYNPRVCMSIYYAWMITIQYKSMLMREDETETKKKTLPKHYSSSFN